MPPLQDLAKIRKERERKKGLPQPITSTVTSPKDKSRKRGKAVSAAGTGLQTEKVLAARQVLKEQPGLAKGEGIIDVDAQIQKRFPAKAKDVTDGITEDVSTGMPSNVTVLPKRADAVTTKAQAPIAQFGLPTDRLPSFNELGGAIGSLFKYIGNLSKFNRARGLVPGVDTATKGKGTGIQEKDVANILQKQLEAANLVGDKEKAAQINARLEAIISPQAAQKQSDIDAILAEE